MNKNIRNKSTNIPSNQQLGKGAYNPSPTHPHVASMNKSGNAIRRTDQTHNGMVKLPKVATVGGTSVSNSSMKAIWESGGVRRANDGSKE